MENQEKKKLPKSTKVCIWVIALLLVVTGVGALIGWDYVYNYAYDDGYQKGQNNNIYKSTLAGTEAQITLYEGYLEYFLDNAVFVTKTGEKYHRFQCQYVQNREIWIYNVENARSQGYEPCSECFGISSDEYIFQKLN